jgi:hypothetical protein
MLGFIELDPASADGTPEDVGTGRVAAMGWYSSKILVSRENAGRSGYSMSVMTTARECGKRREGRFHGGQHDNGRGDDANSRLTSQTGLSWLTTCPEDVGLVIVLLDRRRLVGWGAFCHGLGVAEWITKGR